MLVDWYNPSLSIFSYWELSLTLYTAPGQTMVDSKLLSVVWICSGFPPNHPPIRQEQRKCMYWGIFPPRSRDFSVNILPSMNIKNIIQTDVMSPDVLSLQTFCPHGRFVPQMLCIWMFCPHRCFVCRTFCPSGYFVSPDFFPPDVLSLYVMSGHFVSGFFVWAPPRNGPITKGNDSQWPEMTPTTGNDWEVDFALSPRGR